MNIRDLSYICAVARLGHFGRAAESCHVSQPALSSQIKKLEQELGVQIFERDNKSVHLTEVGEKIVELAQETLRSVDHIRATAEGARDPLSGEIRLGFIPTIAPYLVPHFVTQCRASLPKLSLNFQEDITERLNAGLIDGSLDAAILATPPEHAKLDAIPLYDEPFWVMFPSDHKLGQTANIRSGDLPLEEMLLLAEGHCFRDQAMDVCRVKTGNQRRSIRATSLETLINMVAADQGITLVPAMALGAGWSIDQGIQTEKLHDPAAFRRVYLTYRKSFPRKVLLEALKDIVSSNLPNSVNKIAV